MDDPLSSQQYCLRWNNHQNNLLTVFEEHLNNEAFVDVTLACDGMQMKAHKMVLSACSPYFQSLLFNTPDKHPIVFLKDVKFVEMKALLEFMYRGEVNVDHDCLASLLKVAEDLRIKGLAEVSCNQRDFKFPIMRDLYPRTSSHASNPNRSPTPLALDCRIDPFGGIDDRLYERSTTSASLLPTTSIYLGPKRKRGRPRRLSGFEALQRTFGNPNRIEPETARVKMEHEQGPSSQSGLVTSSGLGISKHNPPLKTENSRNSNSNTMRARLDFRHLKIDPFNLKFQSENDSRSSAVEDRPQDQQSSPGNGQSKKLHQDGQRKHRRRNLSHIYKPKDHEIWTESETTLPLQRVQSGRGRRGQRGRLHVGRIGSRSMSEMSVRGLNLLRYAIVSPDGTLRCIECDQEQEGKYFKNKYSFQRHAFLYHDGAARKVFPCQICLKDFSRPDKMKQHMKLMHEGSLTPKPAPSPSSAATIADESTKGSTSFDQPNPSGVNNQIEEKSAT